MLASLSNTLYPPKAYKDKIRQELFYIKKFGLDNHCKRTNKANHFSYVLRLKGKIQYVYSVEKVSGSKLMDDFMEIFPKFDEAERALR